MSGEEDLELKRLQLKKMIQLASQLSHGQAKGESTKPSQERTPLDVVKESLDYKGLEVLEVALSQYPEETRQIVTRLAELIKSRVITRPIDGGELYNLFRHLGLRVKLETKMVYMKRGEARDLRELFK